MNIGIIASSNGSVFITCYKILKKVACKKFNFYLILDRETDLTKYCKEKKIPYKFILEDDNAIFCKKASEYFSKNNIQVVVLFFLRLVTKDIYTKFYTVNLHPSLLPAYKGFNAIEKAYNDNYKFIGATLHKVDESIDGGKILIQCNNAIKSQYQINDLNKISYSQKVLLLLIFFDYLSNDKFNLDDVFFDCKFKENIVPYFYSELFENEFKKLESIEIQKVINDVG